MFDKNPRKHQKSLELRRFSHFDVTISNRKNIYLNMGILQFNIISELDALVLHSGSANEISVWNTKDGYHLYSFSMDSNTLIPSG